jgi:hypothetical protein
LGSILTRLATKDLTQPDTSRSLLSTVCVEIYTQKKYYSLLFTFFFVECKQEILFSHTSLMIWWERELVSFSAVSPTCLCSAVIWHIINKCQPVNLTHFSFLWEVHSASSSNLHKCRLDAADVLCPWQLVRPTSPQWVLSVKPKYICTNHYNMKMDFARKVYWLSQQTSGSSNNRREPESGCRRSFTISL